MLINILSNSDNQPFGGPSKVLRNTLLGFDLLGVQYVMNQRVSDHQFNWIHDSAFDLIKASILNIPVVAGPNIAVLPVDLPPLLGNRELIIYLHPSEWPKEMWSQYGNKDINIKIWPAGVDHKSFNGVKRNIDLKNVMLYCKNRSDCLYLEAIKIIEANGLNPLPIVYGSYEEQDYKDILQKSLFGVWIGTTESQGMALQEALASNLPLIVLDCKDVNESTDKHRYKFPENTKDFKATSVPYFSKECGLVIESLFDLDESIKYLIKNYEIFHPREFVKNNLTLEKQALELISIFQTSLFNAKSKKRFGRQFVGWFVDLISMIVYAYYRINRKYRRIITREH